MGIRDAAIAKLEASGHAGHEPVESDAFVFYF